MIGGRYDVTTVGPDRVDVGGSFAPNGTSNPAASSNKGKKWSVTRTSVGLYTITFDELAPELDFALGWVQSADGLGYLCEAGNYNASAGTLQLRVHDPRASAFLPLDLFGARSISGNAIQNAAANGGLLAADSTPILERVNGATDKAARVKWAATVVDEIQFPPVPLPAHFASLTDIVVNLRAKMSGATDTPVIAVGAFAGIGDTNAGGNTGALSSTIATVTRTIAAADVGAAPGPLTLTLTPAAHGTDAVELYGAWLTYARLVDLVANANTRIHFVARFRNTSVPY